MFSLVTALVSPRAIDVLRKKKETIVSTLTENANVLCFQPNEDVCLLQGEWESVKKAYAILEEFYFRAQAEVMVREMLKANGGKDSNFNDETTNSGSIKKVPSSIYSSLLPILEPQYDSSSNKNRLPLKKNFNPGREMKGSETGESKLRSRDDPVGDADEEGGPGDRLEERESTENMESTRVDTTTVETEMMAEDDDDEDPPVLYRENTDVISVSSATSDRKELDFYEHLDMLPHGSAFHSEGDEKVETDELAVMKSFGQQSSLSKPDDDDDDDDDEREESSDKILQLKLEEDLIGENKDTIDNLMQQTYGLANPRFLLNQQIVDAASAFRSQQQYYKDTVGSRKLPEFASLFLGNGGLAQGVASWQYADLYNMHLSALQSMHVKQEPSSTISSSNLTPMHFEDDYKNANSGYRFEEDTHVQEMRCMRCDKTYRSEARMKEHVRTHDKDYVPVLHSCPKCSKSFTYRHNMVVHLRRFHYGWQPAKRHACRVCGIKFQKPYLLRLHEHKAHLLRLPSGSME